MRSRTSGRARVSPIADNATAAGRAPNRRVEVEVWYDEFKDATGTEEFVVKNDFQQIKVCRMQTVCKLRYIEGHERRARVQNLVAPLHYDDASLQVSPTFVAQIQRTLENLRDKQHVVVKFIGYTDNSPLAEREARIYGDHETLSKARARRVALAIQDELGLPAEAVDSDGHGTDRALASNETPQGRALNRRIEVEFWYDDSLQELPDEPQLCPGDAGSETVTRVYNPPWGDLPSLQLAQGAPVLPAGLPRQVAPRAGGRIRQDPSAVALRRLHEERRSRSPHRADLRRRHRFVGGARTPHDGSGRRRTRARRASRPNSKAAATSTPTTS